MNNDGEYPGDLDDYALPCESSYRWGVSWKWGHDHDRYVLALPHQCDSWVIGTEEGGRKLIEDLRRLIEMGPPTDPPGWVNVD